MGTVYIKVAGRTDKAKLTLINNMDNTGDMDVEQATMTSKEGQEKSISIIFSLEEAVGALAESLKIFKKNSVNLLHIESRSSVRLPGYEFMVELDVKNGNVKCAMDEIKMKASYFQIITRDYKKNSDAVPWFPVHIRDL